MSKARCTITINEKKDKVRVKGSAKTDDQWLSMAIAMVSSVLESTDEDKRKQYFFALTDVVKKMVFGEEKEETAE